MDELLLKSATVLGHEKGLKYGIMDILINRSMGEVTVHVPFGAYGWRSMMILTREKMIFLEFVFW